MSQEQDLLRKLLKGKSPDLFTPRELGRKAYWYGTRKQRLESTLLWQAAADREDVLAQQEGRPSEAIRWRVRAGFGFEELGDRARSWPILDEATRLDWRVTPALGKEESMADWAFLELFQILAAEGRREEFQALFRRAVQRSEQLDLPNLIFGDATLVELLVDLGLQAELAEAIPLMRKDQDLGSALKKRLQQLEQILPSASASYPGQSS